MKNLRESPSIPATSAKMPNRCHARRLACVLAGWLLAFVAMQATPAAAVQVTEFALPPSSKPIYIVAGPDGNMWFTDRGRNEIGRISMTGQVAEFGLGLTPNAQPNGIAAGPDGNMWFTERTGHQIGRITPAGAISEFSQGLTGTPDIYGIAAGPGGAMWFTETFTGRIGRIDPATGAIHELPGGVTGLFTNIVAGPDGNLWFTVSEPSALIARISPTGSTRQFGPLPSSDCTPGASPTQCPYPESIAVGPEGDLWVDEARGNAIVRLTPLGGISEYSNGLTRGAHVADLVTGPDHNIWFTENASDQVGRITPAGVLTEFGGLSKAMAPFGIAAGPDENLWVAESAGKIARVIPDVPPGVATGPAANASSTAATLSGAVRSRGADTHYYFEYGPSAGYGATTPAQDNGAGDSAQPVSAAVANLQPSTVYHYRLVAVNASGPAYGADQAFVTAPPPPTVTVGAFAMYFRGNTLKRGFLHIGKIVVIGVQSGERVAYQCQRCHGSPAWGARTATSGTVVFATRSLVVNRRTLLQVSVTARNGSRRLRTYGLNRAVTETVLEREQCFLPGGAPAPCPGGSHAAHPKKHSGHRHRPRHRRRK